MVRAVLNKGPFARFSRNSVLEKNPAEKIRVFFPPNFTEIQAAAPAHPVTRPATPVLRFLSSMREIIRGFVRFLVGASFLKKLPNFAISAKPRWRNGLRLKRPSVINLPGIFIGLVAHCAPVQLY